TAAPPARATATASRRSACRRPRPGGSRTGPSAAGYRGQDREGGVLAYRGLQATGETDVLVIDVDVDEAVQLAVLDQARGDAGVPGLEVVDHLGDGGALRLDGLLTAGVGAQDGGDGDGHGHARAPDVVGSGGKGVRSCRARRPRRCART